MCPLRFIKNLAWRKGRRINFFRDSNGSVFFRPFKGRLDPFEVKLWNICPRLKQLCFPLKLIVLGTLRRSLCIAWNFTSRITYPVNRLLRASGTLRRSSWCKQRHPKLLIIVPGSSKSVVFIKKSLSNFHWTGLEKPPFEGDLHFRGGKEEVKSVSSEVLKNGRRMRVAHPKVHIW